jgi:lysozyme
VKIWHKLALSGASAAMIATAIAAHFEGRTYIAYRDVGGTWTLCDGHTRGVHEGMTATDSQCNAWRAQDMAIAQATIHACYPPVPSPQIEAALDDMAFNFGPGKRGVKDGVCVLKSGRAPTILKRAMAGDWRGVCDGLLAWNKADGQVLPGLTKRRAAERAVCLEGVE